MAQRSSASSRRVLPNDTKPEDTNEPEWVFYELDLLDPPPLTEEQKAELAALDNLRDEDIDFSDIPPLTEEFWKNGIRNPHYARALKEQLTIRLDADILDWFKRHAKDGKGYQTDINKALRAYVVAQEKRAARKAG
jgi:uncharacterized protein (DUF4415 family)